eukprot:470268-Rhodomonas_salina.2
MTKWQVLDHIQGISSSGTAAVQHNTPRDSFSDLFLGKQPLDQAPPFTLGALFSLPSSRLDYAWFSIIGRLRNNQLHWGQAKFKLATPTLPQPDHRSGLSTPAPCHTPCQTYLKRH